MIDNAYRRGVRALLLSLALQLFPFLLSGQSPVRPPSAAPSSDSLRLRELVFYFPQNSSRLDPGYLGNRQAFQSLDSIFTHPAVKGLLDSIYITGSSSPLGRSGYNDTLSLRRGESLKSYMLATYRGLDPVLFHVRHIGVDWSAFRAMVQSDGGFPLRRQVLDVLDSKVLSNDGKLWRLRLLLYGLSLSGKPGERGAWYYAALQYVSVLLSLKDGSHIQSVGDLSPYAAISPAAGLSGQEPVSGQDSTATLEAPEEISVSLPPPSVFPPAEPSAPGREKAGLLSALLRQYPLYLKTNLLYTAVLLPNLSLETPAGRRWSVSLEGLYSRWDTGSPDYLSHRVQWAGAEVRRWLGVHSARPLSGYFAGVYLSGGLYDLRLFTTGTESYGYQSSLSWSAGVSCGYSLPLSAVLSLEFSIRAGYFGGRYHAYNRSRCADCYPDMGNGRLDYWGPTGLGLSLVYRLGPALDRHKTGKEVQP